MYVCVCMYGYLAAINILFLSFEINILECMYVGTIPWRILFRRRTPCRRLQSGTRKSLESSDVCMDGCNIV